MAGPVNLAVNLVGELLSRVKDVKTNSDECQLLGSMAHQTMRIVEQLESRQFESSLTSVLEQVNDALKEVLDAVSACCNANFFTAMVYKQNFSLKLKHAAAKLNHALSRISLATLEMTSNVQSDLVALTTQIKYTRFEERAATSHLIIDLKDAFERAFIEDRKGREEVRNLVQQLVREQASTHEELQKLMEMLRGDSKEAKENKERQMEFEINEVIAAVAKSINEIKYLSKFTHNMKIALRCPITQELMQDPVMVKESGMTYDRSSIMEWFNRGHFEDPLTNLTLKSRELVSDHTVRTLIQSVLGESGSSTSSPSNSNVQAKECTPCLQPGVYEGHGRFTIGLDTILAFQLLLFEPDGNAIGYTLYKKENTSDERNSLEIGKGEWTSYTLKLVYEDQCFWFLGECDYEINDECTILRWTGKVSRRGEGQEKNDFIFLHSPPPVRRIIWPSPEMMQIEGSVVETQTQIKYNSTLMLRLQDDANVDGWMWFEVSSQKPKVIGRIIRGRWKSNGCISIIVQFPPKGVLPNSRTKPTNNIAIFEIDGQIEQRGNIFGSAFNARIIRKESDTKLQKEALNSTPLEDLTSLEFHKIRSISSSWNLLHTKALQDFQTTENHKSEAQLCANEAKIEVNFDYMHYCLHAKGWSSLHVASRDNFIDMTKELVAKGANLECQDNNGWTPLYVASEYNAIDVVKELITNGANIECQDTNGWTSLYVAARNNAIDVVKKLIVEGANIECQSKNRFTPLYAASEYNAIDVVKELIANGANIERQDENGLTPLYVASKNYAIDVVKALITNGANIECQDEYGGTPLYVASINNCIDVLKELVANGANIECKDKYGWAPLHVASINNCIDVVKELISKSANIECRNNDGWTPLQSASKNNCIDVLKVLIANGANIECQDEIGETPLFVASKNNCIDVVKELTANGANTECHNMLGVTPLYDATENNRIDMLKELIANGANIESQDKDGRTPLYYASENSHINVLKELIYNGANTECRDMKRRTPLFAASKNNCIDVLEELITNGANIECQDEDGWTPLHVASSKNNIDVVKELIVKGANIECQDNNGWTPLHFASENNHIDVVKELIAKGANIECQEEYGVTPLHWASYKNNIDVVKELIANGANIECQDNDGVTPLHLASRRNSIDVVKELIANGANIECQDNDGMTPLHLASRENSIDVVKELIAKGANIECQSNDGWTPLHLASSRGYVEVVDILLKHGASKTIKDH